MLKRTDLREAERATIRYRGEDAEALTIPRVCETIRALNERDYGLPLRVERDQLKSGNLFHSTVEECLTITNAEHVTDYLKYCLVLQKQGKMAYISTYTYGQSVLSGKAYQAEQRKGSLGGMLLNAISGVDQAAYDAEGQYYDMLNQLLDEVLGG